MWHNISDLIENGRMDRNQERNRTENNKAPYNEQVNEGKAGGVITEYIVEEKDTIRDIAIKYGVSIEEILAANPELNEPADMVKPGMKISIPKKMH
jgi:LysM repeat protein